MLDRMRGWATLHVVLPSLHDRPSIGANALHTIDTTINLLIWAALATPANILVKPYPLLIFDCRLGRNIAIAISCVPATRPLLASVTHLINDKASRYGGRQSHSKRSGQEDVKLSTNLSGAQGSQTFESPATVDHSTKSGNASTRCESEEGIVPLHPVDAV